MLHAAQHALLQSSLPLSGWISTNTVGFSHDSPDLPVLNPSPKIVAAAASLHVLAFRMPAKALILMESEGVFRIKDWKEAEKTAKEQCEVDEVELRETLVKKIEEGEKWKRG